jgi:hypothetical protein
MNAAVEMAREDLVRRIRPFVAILERVRRQPNRREAYHVLFALECPQAGNYQEGGKAMSDAEHVVALPAALSGVQGIHEKMTTQQLNARLAEILASDDAPG